MTPTQRKYAEHAADGATLAEIAVACGTTSEAVRAASYRGGFKVRNPLEIQNYRETAEKMRPLDAVNYLLDVIEFLTPALSDQHPIDAWGLKLAPMERRLLAILYDAKGECAPRERLMDVLYSDQLNDAPSDKIINVLICKLRQKIPAGVSIATHWGRGFSLHFERGGTR